MVPVLAQRDFLSRVKSWPYIITTIIGMLVFIGLSFAPLIMQHFAASFEDRPVDILVVDYTGEFYPFLAEVAAVETGITEEIRPGQESSSFQRVLDEGKDGLLLVDLPHFAFATVDAANYGQHSRVERLVNESLTRFKAYNLGLSTAEIAQLFAPAELEIRQIGSGITADHDDLTSSMLLAYFMIFMIYMTLVLYGNMVASGVAEEKSSRIMEVMIAKVKPMELMFGKIIGIGTLGLMQFIIWITTAMTAIAVRRSGLFSAAVDLGVSFGQIESGLLMWFVLFFVLGFFFYASIFAAGGAVVSRVEEVNQVVTLVTMLIVVGFITAFMSFANPNGQLAVVASLVPFTSPMVMFARLTLADPPAIQVAASVLILIAGVLGGTWFSGKIYRIGVLLYGKRPTFREVLRYMRG